MSRIIWCCTDSLSSSYLLGRVLDPTGAPVGGAKLLCSGQISGFGVYVTKKEVSAVTAGSGPGGSLARVPGAVKRLPDTDPERPGRAP